MIGNFTLTEMYAATFEVFSVNELDATCRLARYSNTSPDTLDQLWRTATAAGADPVAADAVLTALCGNPDCPTALLDDVLADLVDRNNGHFGNGSGIHRVAPKHPHLGYGSGVHRVALTHPHLGPAASKVADELGGHRGSLLANPACDPDVLDTYWADAPFAVMANPNTSRSTLRTALDSPQAPHRGADYRFHAAAHPRAPRQIVIDAGNHSRADLRALAYRNPNQSPRALRQALERELERHGPDSVAVDVLTDRLEVWIPEDWRDERVTVLVQNGLYGGKVPRFRAPIGNRLTSVDDDVRVAARTLVRSGFDGTVGELLDVAATFDDHQLTTVR